MEADVLWGRRPFGNRGAYSWYQPMFSEGKEALRLLRLRQIHNAVFVRLNKATMEKLRHFNEGGE